MTRYLHQSLVADGSLVLSIDESLRDAASQWMPRLPEKSASRHPRSASIRIDRGDVQRPPLSGAPMLALGRVRAWLSDTRDTVWLENSGATLQSSVDLTGRVAHIVAGAADEVQQNDMTSMLTIVAALLLVRDGRTPIHAGAVVDAATGLTWLIAGDSHSGKSTTTANLIRAGWSYLSDDYVVLSPESGGISAEGWPDDFHLDEGWRRGESTGTRTTVVEADFADKRVASAKLGGVLFPSVSADQPTQIEETSAAVALERLIRQSPWLVADSESGPKVFDLLARAAALPSANLRLGLDTFANPELLSRVVREFTESKR